MQIFSVFSADLLSVVWKCAWYFLQICSVLSADLLGVVCRPPRCCMQTCSVLSADLLGFVCKPARCCLQTCSVLSADLLGVVCRSSRCCLQIFISVNWARPCSVQGLNHLMLSRAWSLPFILIVFLASLHLYVLFCLTYTSAYMLFPSF